MIVNLNLATATGQQILAALTWDILRCEGKAAEELPLKGVADFELWEVFDHCINIPEAQELAANWHRAMGKTSQAYWQAEASMLTNAFPTMDAETRAMQRLETELRINRAAALMWGSLLRFVVCKKLDGLFKPLSGS